MHVETAPRMPPTSRLPLHPASRARVMGSTSREKPYRSKNRPAYPRTVLGLTQQRVTLTCGPGSGAPVGVQNQGHIFVPLYLYMGSQSRARDHTKQSKGGKPR